MAVWGTDIAQLKTLGTKLQAGSSGIDKQKSLLTRVLEGTDWKGPGTDKFRSEWNGQHTARTHRVRAVLVGTCLRHRLDVVRVVERFRHYSTLTGR